MKDSRMIPEFRSVLVHDSADGKPGSFIECPCGEEFSVGGSDSEVICPSCLQLFQSGFSYEFEVVSRYSGMSLGIYKGAQPGQQLDSMVHNSVKDRFGSDCSQTCLWSIRDFSKAYFPKDDQ